MRECNEILNRYHIDYRDFPEVKETIKKKFTEQGKKWTSASGENLNAMINLLDKDFNDALIRDLTRISRELSNKENEIWAKKQELDEREKEIIAKESTAKYSFEDPKYHDAYVLSEALKNSFKTKYGTLEKEVQIRIIDMVENLVKESDDK